MRVLWILLVGILPLMSCHGTNTTQGDSSISAITSEDEAIATKLLAENEWATQPILSDTLYRVKCMGKLIEVRFIVSKKVASGGRKLLLLLPGWNYSDTQWCTRTKVCEQATKRGYDLMFVEMGKSVYMDSIYPEMRNDYKTHPTRTWLWDSVLKPLQERGYFTHKGIPEIPVRTGGGIEFFRDLRLPIPSYVMGLSTGGRGAMLLGLEHPEAFCGIASLSGDYDPTLMPSDNLMINCMGRFAAFPKRWMGSNNICQRIAELKVPCFIAHGQADAIVPVNQALQLKMAHASTSANTKPENQALSKSDNRLNSTPLNVGAASQSTFIVRILESGGHDYSFWNQTGIEALDFFDSINK